MSIRLAVTAAVSAFALVAASSLVSHAADAPDFDYFKAKVQPIFVTKRPGHARCVMCHAEANNALRLEKLPAGQETWNEEQTRKNYDTVVKIVGLGQGRNVDVGEEVGARASGTARFTDASP